MGKQKQKKTAKPRVFRKLGSLGCQAAFSMSWGLSFFPSPPELMASH